MHQVKGRVFEATASGCLLLETFNARTKDFFKEGTEYIESAGKEDLLNKILYYLNNVEEMKKIAEAGNKRFQDNYTHNHFWDEVFGRLNKNI